MKKCSALLVTIIAFYFSACSQLKISMEQLKFNIDTLLQRQQGSFAAAFKDIQTGKTIFINEHEIFHAASTMKTPVLVEVFKQANEKKFSLSDSLIIKNEFKSIVDSSLFSLNPDDDSDLELYKHIGEKKSINDLVYLMITVSSNFATNLLIDLVNAKNVTQTMRKMGLKDLKVLRGVEDQKAYDKGLNNVVTAYDLSLLFEKIAKGEAENKSSCDAMIKVLMDQKFNEIIPAKLPPNVKVAHKTGWLKGINHDSGIVFLPDGRKYVLVLLSKNTTDDKAAVNAMATVSLMIYNFLLSKNKKGKNKKGLHLI
jgi:beta-lactamase class A